MAFDGTGHYGILRLGDMQVGGFLQWGLMHEVGPPPKSEITGKRIASAKEWWVEVVIPDNKCKAYFYRIENGEEVLKDELNIVFTCGSREKNKLIKTRFEMRSY